MCDTLIALGNSTKNGKVMFAKNSDREPDEPAEILHIPRTIHPKNTELKATYISLPQVEETVEIILCKPIWIWGAEMGTNEYGVTIGNEAVYTKEKYQKRGGLLGMDLLRLGLERGKSAKESLEVIIDLLETYGQGGNCGYRNKLFYHNSFIIADKKEAWILETAGKYWIAEKVENIASISNSISIQGKGDIRHPELIEHALSKKWTKSEENFNFGNDYVAKYKIEQIFARGRLRAQCSYQALKKQQGKISEKTMLDNLRIHLPEKKNWSPDKNASFKSICIHYRNIFNPSQSTISMVSVLDEEIQTHWITGTSAPCTSIFKPVYMPGGTPTIGTKTTEYYDKQNIWWSHEVLHRLTLRDYIKRINHYQKERDQFEEESMLKSNALVDSMKKKGKNEKNREQIIEQLRNFTNQKFKEALLLEEKWIEMIENLPIDKPASILYRKRWKKLNKRNKIPI